MRIAIANDVLMAAEVLRRVIVRAGGRGGVDRARRR